MERLPRSQVDLVSLVGLERDFVRAGASPGRLRSLDALHLAVALRIGAQEFIAYDLELGAAAEQAGLTLLSPGR